ncbi:MAG: hypothetical protein KF789_10730 [Bdellovibrionaceae bacterium]|nr:hypothetical protein [Pseudobdellovibrionaceae bacterium]
MNKQTQNLNTNELLKRIPLLLTMLALTTPTWLIACASINRREESVHAILQKENALIEKLQAQPEIAQAVSENESLKKAETHLALSLEELKGANETIKAKILKVNKEEVQHGRD